MWIISNREYTKAPRCTPASVFFLWRCTRASAFRRRYLRICIYVFPEFRFHTFVSNDFCVIFDTIATFVAKWKKRFRCSKCSFMAVFYCCSEYFEWFKYCVKIVWIRNMKKKRKTVALKYQRIVLFLNIIWYMHSNDLLRNILKYLEHREIKGQKWWMNELRWRTFEWICSGNSFFFMLFGNSIININKRSECNLNHVNEAKDEWAH